MSSPFACFKCSPGYVYYSGNCLTICPNSYTPDINGRCIQCPSGCATCNAAGECTSCQSGYQLAGSMCTNGCGQGMYWWNGSCLGCPSQCLYCNASSSCIKCSNGLYLATAGTVVCNQTCVKGTYPDNTTFMCQPCPSNCLACTSASNCTQCFALDPLYYYLYKGSCLLNCPNGTYMDYIDGTSKGCLLCSPECSSCYGPTKDQCLTCLKGYVMDLTSCNKNCTPGKYSDNTSHCDSCDTICQTCFGPA